jgi:riboflavin kinase/FMN adenylyltransferase
VSAPAFAAGVFDGVHVGHRRVLEALLALDPAGRVLVFDEPRADGRALTSLERRTELLRDAGVQDVHVVPSTAPIAPADGALYVSGPAYKVRYVPAQIVDVPLVEGVSSELIRRLVASGDLAGAAAQLGRPFDVDGIVVHGDHRGRLLGFPTANLDLPPDRLLPPNGIYAGSVGDHRAAISIGVNPHYGGHVRRFEAHLLDFDGDLYGQRLVVELWSHLRGELAFESEEQLVAAIAADVAATRLAARP